jgi:5-methyltetrahydropteroyltriglutamate--homocysteine methyltransferase
MDLSEKERQASYRFYEKLGKLVDICLITYYDDVDHLECLYDLPVKAIGIDFVHGRENIKTIGKKGFPSDKILVAGVVSGKNVFCVNPERIFPLIDMLRKHSKGLMLSNAGPLYHLPETTANENLPLELKERILFAGEKIAEIASLAKGETLYKTKDMRAGKKRRRSNIVYRVNSLTVKDFRKKVSYRKRILRQKMLLKLPDLPTTTIGSFPQTNEVRAMRSLLRRGDISREKYHGYIHGRIRANIVKQENLGLDVLVHGEPERTDMVEYFAGKLEGFFTSEHGWVVSYGTRA